MAKDEVKITVKVFNEEFNKAMKDMRESSSKLNREFRLQEEQMKHSATESEKLGAKLEFLNKKQELAKQRVQETEKQYEKAKEQFGENSKTAEEMAKNLDNARIQEQRLANQITETTKELHKQSVKIGETGEKLKDFGDKTKAAGQGLTAGLTVPIIAAGGSSLKAAIDFESAFAGVRKTVDATEEEFDEFKQGIRDMAKEMPAAATEISKVAESAGQLGIQKDAILEFTRTMIDLGEATNMTSDQAATEFARFANIVGMSQEDFDRLGSAIVALGNSMATTESEISSMAMRLAAQGSQVGMSEAQIMALAGTMSSLGIEAEAGGTAMTTVLKKIQGAVGEGGEELKAFAEAAGVSSEEFKNAWENDAVVGLDMLIKGLSNSADEGKNLTTILDTLGIKGIREADTMLRLAGASDLLASAVETSTGAWDENLALTQEAEQRYATTESQLKIMWNRIKDVGITLGDALIPALLATLDAIQPLIDFVGRLAEWFTNLSPQIQQVILVISGIAVAIGPVLIAVGWLISAIGSIMQALAPLMLSITQAGGLIAFLGAKFGALVAAITGPVGIIIASIVGLIAIFVALYNKNETFREGVNLIWSKITGYFKEALAFIGGIVRTVMTEITSFFSSQLAEIRAFWQENGAGIKATVEFYFKLIASYIDLSMGIIKGIFQIVWPFISNATKIAWELIKTIIKNGVDIVLGVIQFFLRIFKGDWSGAFESIKETAMKIMSNIIGFFQSINLVEIGKDIIKGLIKGIGSMVGAVKDKVRELAGNIPSWAKEMLGIRSPSRVMIEVGEDTGEGAIVGLERKIKDARKVAADLAQSIIPNMENQLNVATTTNATFARGQIEAIQNAFSSAISHLNAEPLRGDVYIDGHVAGRVTAPYVKEENDFQEARVGVFRG